MAQPDGERQVIRQNIIHLADFDDEETDFPDVTAGEDERLVHYAISMPHSKTQPALPVPGLNGADGGRNIRTPRQGSSIASSLIQQQQLERRPTR